ncbi:DUF7210 family protein [Paenibacillus segetis]|uniref:DUF7210 domain-containing protein n=1 Tax=Paenibacillus segetis TaxID=1325360 RepID=A0ABQ1YAP7_9BACL|nr:hypothetical protein [Paenibacillus segetis]GGH17293.1 hypothetical protein GCM10008013_12540 [Paenibacillus segetis]
MNIKVTGKVKHNGEWYGPGDVIPNVDEDDGNRIITIRAGDLLPKTQEEIAAEESAELAKKVEEERKAAAEKEQKEVEKQLKALRKKATDLGIQGVAEMDAETLAAEIEVAQQK